MTSRVAKAQIPVKAGEELVFSEDDWKAAEDAYGHQLSQEVRPFIWLAIDLLFFFGKMERAAPEQREIIAKVKDLRNAAETFLQVSGYPTKNVSKHKSFETMTEHTATVIKEYSYDYLQFTLVVDLQFAACNLMLSNCESNDGLRPGSAWVAFVKFITEVLQLNGLPTEVRKDKSKRRLTESNSPFVRLIEALQRRIPEDLLPKRNSLDALSQAIYRARQQKLPELFPSKVMQRYADYFESPGNTEEQLEIFVKAQLFKAAFEAGLAATSAQGRLRAHPESLDS